MTSRSGLLLVDKATGLTSHDVVAKLRHILHERRIGHAGTLDPMATGLLVVAVGPSTRLLRFAQAETKRYSGTVRLGAATSTLDADGEVVATAAVPELSDDAVNTAAAALSGRQFQVPPMVSALKVAGRRLYEIAREGGHVEREPREITISQFALARAQRDDEWTFDVTCTSGTYVRVLLADLAESLGTLGHLAALRRLASGQHRVEDASTLEDVAAQVAAGEDPLDSPLGLVEALVSARLSEEQVAAVRHGQRVELAGITGDEVAAIDPLGHLVAVLARREQHWQPSVVLPVSE